MLSKLLQMKKGFTLIEVLVAIFLITVGALGAMALVNQTITFSQLNSSKLVAAYLAQEGLEIVKNIRDSNFLKIHKGEAANWDDGLTGCEKGCEADYNDLALSPGDRYLQIDDGGFYNYDSGLNTPFKRKIFVVPDGPDILKVSVEVSWTERGRKHQIAVQENLYNWFK